MKCLDVRQPQPVHLAALEVLAKFDSADVPAMVLAAWPSMSPKIRATAIETLLARPAWVTAFLDAVEKKTVLPTDLEPARVQLLLKSPDEKVRVRRETVRGNRAVEATGCDREVPEGARYEG